MVKRTAAKRFRGRFMVSSLQCKFNSALRKIRLQSSQIRKHAGKTMFNQLSLTIYISELFLSSAFSKTFEKKTLRSLRQGKRIKEKHSAQIFTIPQKNRIRRMAPRTIRYQPKSLKSCFFT